MRNDLSDLQGTDRFLDFQDIYEALMIEILIRKRVTETKLIFRAKLWNIPLKNKRVGIEWQFSAPNWLKIEIITFPDNYGDTRIFTIFFLEKFGFCSLVYSYTDFYEWTNVVHNFIVLSD